jgi:hypothetical protein
MRPRAAVCLLDARRRVLDSTVSGRLIQGVAGTDWLAVTARRSARLVAMRA